MAGKIWRVGTNHGEVKERQKKLVKKIMIERENRRSSTLKIRQWIKELRNLERENQTVEERTH